VKGGHFFLELDIDQVRLRAVGLPVGLQAVVPQEVHSVSGLGARHRPHRAGGSRGL